ncbi:hypothetical protein [Janthinobacterium sp. MP5059B]|uniref:hypothetical protein n=1 Tax=Janthinobacterium sp. MP5059B TaxID=1766683 RepID=UPI0008744526|nr:hypothetical protein [Janthinobacterium sp. MP5059B]
MKYPYLTVALLVIFGIIDIAILGNHYELTKSDWSGWVQAIGSIAALGVAIYIMTRQNQHAARLLIDADKRALMRRADATAAVIDRAMNQLQQFCKLITESLAVGNENNIRSAILTSQFALQEAQGATRAIPAQELGSYKMVSGLSKIVQSLSTFDKWAEVLLNDPLLPAIEDIQRFLTRTLSNCENSKMLFFEGVEALKAE